MPTQDPPETPSPARPSPASRHLRAVWTFCGLLSLGLGILGIFLPVLPTTPFVLLAAFCFARGSPRLHAWLLGSKRFGPMIADWEATGAIPRRVKFTACAVMAATFSASALIGVPGRVLVAQAVLMGIGAAYILTRHDR